LTTTTDSGGRTAENGDFSETRRVQGLLEEGDAVPARDGSAIDVNDGFTNCAARACRTFSTEE